MYYKTCNKCFEEKSDREIKRDICKDCEEQVVIDKVIGKGGVTKSDWNDYDSIQKSLRGVTLDTFDFNEDSDF